MWNIGRIELNCHLGRKHELELEEYVFFLTGFQGKSAQQTLKNNCKYFSHDMK